MTDLPPTPRRLRVLHSIPYLGLGGAQEIAITLAEALRAEVDFGFHAVRGLRAESVGRAQVRRIEQLPARWYGGPAVPMRLGGMLTGALGLSRALRQYAPDVIHLHTEIPEASYATLAALRPSVRRIPVVRTIHSSGYWDFCRPLGCWCDRRMGRSHCSAVSQDALSAVRKLRAESQAAAFASEPVVIADAVAPLPQRTAERAKPNAPWRIAFGGRLEREKGADLLPAILAGAPLPSGASATLAVFGDGSLMPELRRLASAPPDAWTVELHPPSPQFREQLHEYDLVIVPSRSEGLCLVALEAISAGVPVVITDAPGLRETVPTDYEWTARAGEPMSIASTLQRAMAASPDQRRQVLVRAQDHVQSRFSLAHLVHAYRELYARAIAAPTA